MVEAISTLNRVLEESMRCRPCCFSFSLTLSSSLFLSSQSFPSLPPFTHTHTHTQEQRPPAEGCCTCAPCCAASAMLCSHVRGNIHGTSGALCCACPRGLGSSGRLERCRLVAATHTHTHPTPTHSHTHTPSLSLFLFLFLLTKYLSEDRRLR